MAGSFGYKSEYCDLSVDIGGDLQDQFADERNRNLVASGTSCTKHMSDLFARSVTHPIETVAPER
jgi:hypothetical protein